MNLIIHDLSETEWESFRQDYDGWDVISDTGTIRPCVGCFSCWNKTPGTCVIRDGYEDMGKRIHQADAVTVISRYTYGGFSGFVKNVFDRCLGYVLPQFEVINGETHHQKRYDEDKPFTFIFRGDNLSPEEKESAERYVTAVCANFRGTVKEVIFISDGAAASKREEQDIPKGRTVLLNASMRSENGNSAVLARELAKGLQREYEILDLKKYLNSMEDLLAAVEDASTVVLCMPLYVDGLPSQLIRLMELFEMKYQGRSKRIYVLSNMGLYESRQLVNLFEAVRQWCLKMGFEYCGGLGVSAGELIGTLMQILPFNGWPSSRIAKGMSRLLEAVNSGKKTDDLYTEPYGFPRWLYLEIANRNWNILAKKNGLKPEDLYRKL